MSIQPWTVLESKEIFRSSLTRFRSDRCQLPNGKIMPAYYTLEFGDWVNIVPVTKSGEIVLIRQYRHALNEVTIEIPGGAADVSDENVMEAAERELLEETGYVAQSVEQIMTQSPNPAMQNNRMHTFLALGCERLHPQKLDPFEDIEVFTAKPNEVLDLMSSGEIHHSIVVASLFSAFMQMGILAKGF